MSIHATPLYDFSLCPLDVSEGSVRTVYSDLCQLPRNPSVLSDSDGYSLFFSYGRFHQDIELNHINMDYPDVAGTFWGISLPISILKKDFILGAAIYFADQWITRVRVLPYTAVSVYGPDNAYHRFDGVLALSTALTERLYIGIGAKLLIAVSGGGLRLSIDQYVLENGEFNSYMPIIASPILGLSYRDNRFWASFAYRHRVQMDVSLNIVADLSYSQLKDTALIGFKSTDYLTPSTFEMAAGFNLKDVALGIDVEYLKWSGSFEPPRIRYVLVGDLDTVMPTGDYELFKLKDTINVTFGINIKLLDNLYLIFAIKRKNSPMKEKITSVPKVIFPSKWVVGMGFSLQLKEGSGLFFSGAMQLHLIDSNLYTPSDPLFDPLGDVYLSGRSIGAALGMGYTF